MSTDRTAALQAYRAAEQAWVAAIRQLRSADEIETAKQAFKAAGRAYRATK